MKNCGVLQPRLQTAIVKAPLEERKLNSFTLQRLLSRLISYHLLRKEAPAPPHLNSGDVKEQNQSSHYIMAGENDSEAEPKRCEGREIKK